jgi:hypothetical protein
MFPKMTRNALLVFGLLYALPSFATVDSPVVQGLAGAERAGVPREALFSNPASVAAITTTYGFYHFEIPSIPDFNAGGRAWSAGIYDGGDQHWKGGFGYSRVAKARIFNGRQGYIDRREIRFASGHAIYGGVTGGLATRYIKNYNDSSDPGSFLEGDLGLEFPLFSDMRGGITFENVLNREDDSPQTLGAGAAYALGMGFNIIGDAYRLMSGTKSGNKGYALAGEAGLVGDITVRAGILQEAYRMLHGWSVGATWMGPRMSLDYAFKMLGAGPKERAHVLGLTLQM